MKPVYLLGCPAEVSDDKGTFAGKPPKVSLVGLFDVEEFHPYEPSAYVHSPCYTVIPHGADPDDPLTYSVDAYDLEEQANPKAHARDLVLEREMAFAEEWECRR